MNDVRSGKIIESKEDLALLQQHLKEIVEGTAFRGSHRSAQFLTYIVERAIGGNFDSLKERIIGVELFGRSPSYDTGDDAIVRVTASDVRKRLLQHYGKYGATSKFRISLPLGSYVPEITREQYVFENGHHDTQSAQPPAAAAHPEPIAEQVEPAAAPKPSHILAKHSFVWLIFAVALVTLNLVLWVVFRPHSMEAVQPLTLPWSVLFSSPRAIHLITSDPDIAEMQQYTRNVISISDYANHQVIPKPNNMTPEIRHFWEVILKGEKAAAVDTQIAVNIAELAQANGKTISVRPARSLQLSDLQNDDNFILFGSPRSDPWSSLFSDQLDFRFVFDGDTGQEIIRNFRPREHEPQQYVPTALGGATGQSYAIFALVRNPDQNGQVLLLAGANAEGTEAAGKILTDLPRLASTLQACGVYSTGSLPHFEVLLKLNTMAGSPSNAYVQACHILSASPNHP